MRKKRWMSIMLVLCMILTLLPINTAYADEADTQKDANQVEEVQSDEDIVMQTEQVQTQDIRSSRKSSRCTSMLTMATTARLFNLSRNA